eukprot:CAMPEP_0181216210 /NCGR_PEP_ID=MMETSP1096-20121128/26453_1 /TAXON_ID=156174 ORGANISM="Chrysochromulina ericina, Strain CCMP281" /NCGR_SAMPLE_ID=MMETSP1096 /ASSEMBLY_ACC=CAM_ASM_000453 /LENGTH=132 /DNA_ID=CAMNT_0023308173 /DNA_START=148 /DNA_END=547 /DNA_ORIENTATION=-
MAGVPELQGKLAIAIRRQHEAAARSIAQGRLHVIELLETAVNSRLPLLSKPCMWVLTLSPCPILDLSSKRVDNIVAAVEADRRALVADLLTFRDALEGTPAKVGATHTLRMVFPFEELAEMTSTAIRSSCAR